MDGLNAWGAGEGSQSARGCWGLGRNLQPQLCESCWAAATKSQHKPGRAALPGACPVPCLCRHPVACWGRGINPGARDRTPCPLLPLQAVPCLQPEDSPQLGACTRAFHNEQAQNNILRHFNPDGFARHLSNDTSCDNGGCSRGTHQLESLALSAGKGAGAVAPWALRKRESRPFSRTGDPWRAVLHIPACPGPSHATEVSSMLGAVVWSSPPAGVAHLRTTSGLPAPLVLG